MRDTTNGAIETGGCLTILIWLFFIGCWIGNVVKLVNCDFEPSYREEVIHTIGLVAAPASVVTVWF